MPSPTDLKGKYLGFKLDMGGSTPALDALIAGGQLVLSVDNDASILVAIPAKVYTAKSDAGPFTASGVPLSFRFLKYVPGGITTAALTTATMTGPMSGCFVFKYTDNDNQEILAHVGTVGKTDAKTIAVKNAWKTLAAGMAGVAGVAPFPDVFRENQLGPYGGKASIVAYFSGGGAHAMILVPLGITSAGQMMKVADVKSMDLVSWAKLQHHQKFA